MKRVLLLGSTGYVGTEFGKALGSRGYVVIPVGRSEIQSRSVDQIAKFFEDHKSDFLLNCAGYTGKPNVDACEQDKVNCLAGNAVLPGVISQACFKIGLKWGHVSSGCIFTGCRIDGLGFSELDPPNFCFRTNNCSFYSGTKALGEEILSGDPNCYIWRLRIPISNHDSARNYLSKMMRYDTLLEAVNSLSYLPEFVRACVDCFEKNVATGIYNLTNPGSISTTEVVAMLRDTGVCNKEFRFFKTEDQFMSVAATTPRSNCVLDSSKALNAGLILRPIRAVIRECLENWVWE